jgi:sorbitol-specific phosphotransferase system component IIC
MIEYKGFFCSVNRDSSGTYHGVVSGINETGLKIKAMSIIQLRTLFKSVVDEYLKHLDISIKKREDEKINIESDLGDRFGQM